MVVTKIAEISPTGAGTRPERPVSQKAQCFWSYHVVSNYATLTNLIAFGCFGLDNYETTVWAPSIGSAQTAVGHHREEQTSSREDGRLYNGFHRRARQGTWRSKIGHRRIEAITFMFHQNIIFCRVVWKHAGAARRLCEAVRLHVSLGSQSSGHGTGIEASRCDHSTGLSKA